MKRLLALPPHRQQLIRRVVRRVLGLRALRKILRAGQYLALRDVYVANAVLASGRGPLEALWRGIGPFVRWGEIIDQLIEERRPLPPPPWLDRVAPTGFDRVTDLHGRGTPIIIVVPHLGLTGLLLLQWLAAKGFPAAGGILTPGVFHDISNLEAYDVDQSYLGYLALRRGKILLYGGDAPGPGVPVRFLGRSMSLPLLAARLAGTVGAALVPAYCYERAPGSWQAVFEEPLYVGDRPPEEVVRTVAQRLERAIRAHPFEWVAYRPHLTRVAFPTTGELRLLLAIAGPDAADQRTKYARRLAAYAGLTVDDADAQGLSLGGLTARLRAARQDVLVLVRPELGDELAELPSLLTWFYRLDPDWVAYDPPAGADGAGTVSSYSLTLVKTAVLEALVRRGVERLDARALARAKRAGFRCYRVMNEATLSATLRRIEEEGIALPAVLL